MRNVQLRSSRLLLRGLRPDDEDAILRYANDPELTRYTSSIPHPYPGRDAVQAFIWQSTESRLRGDRLELAIELAQGADGKATGLIGMVALSGIDRQRGSAELGYWLARPFWNQGIMTEAARLMLVYAFGVLRLRRVCARCYAANRASARVLEKLGMILEGHVPGVALQTGRPTPLLQFSMRRAEWLARHSGSRKVALAQSRHAHPSGAGYRRKGAGYGQGAGSAGALRGRLQPGSQG